MRETENHKTAIETPGTPQAGVFPPHPEGANFIEAISRSKEDSLSVPFPGPGGKLKSWLFLTGTQVGTIHFNYERPQGADGVAAPQMYAIEVNWIWERDIDILIVDGVSPSALAGFVIEADGKQVARDKITVDPGATLTATGSDKATVEIQNAGTQANPSGGAVNPDTGTAGKKIIATANTTAEFARDEMGKKHFSEVFARSKITVINVIGHGPVQP